MNNEIKEKFIPGEEWLYYKIYCGIHSANEILINYISPLTKTLLEEGIICKWFFIRYSEPENHIRIRFLLKNTEHTGKVIKTFKSIILPLIATNKIWNIELGTYKRELLRYGRNTIELSESLFFENSEYIIKIIKESKGTEDLFFTIFNYIESLINSFKFSKEMQILFLDNMTKAYKKEFNGLNKRTNKSISYMYRKFKNNLVNDTHIDIGKVKDISNEITSLFEEKQLEPDIEELLASFIHMTVNRGFNMNQRIYEMLLYDFMHKKYKSIYARL